MDITWTACGQIFVDHAPLRFEQGEKDLQSLSSGLAVVSGPVYANYPLVFLNGRQQTY